MPVKSTVQQIWGSHGRAIRKTMQKFWLLIKEIVNWNYPDVEKRQENKGKDPEKQRFKEYEATGKRGKG